MSRSDDKFERILNVIKNKDESLYYNIDKQVNPVVEDALMDMAGYAINALRLLYEKRLTKRGNRIPLKDRSDV